MKDVLSKLTGKVDSIEFNKQLERIDNNVTIFSDKVEYKLPAMEKQFTDMIQKKADIAQVNEALELKADKTDIEKLIERINEVHEVAAQANAKAEKKNESSDDEEIVVGENGEFAGDPESPDSVKKKKRKKGEPDSEEERQREELRRQQEEAMEAMREKIELLEKSLASNAEEYRKGLRDGEFALKKLEKEVYDKIDEQKKQIV